MNSQTFVWFVFLALIKNFCHASDVLFKLLDSHLTAKEGSCIDIKCKVTASVDDSDANWHWIKDAFWNETTKDFEGTIIYCEPKSFCPVSPEFETRVKYIGSPSANWKYATDQKLCNISICNLNKNDSGEYLFRFHGNKRWATKPVNLSVEENPCPITFEKPPVVKEGDIITLTCSTLSSCPSDPQIQNLTQLLPDEHSQGHAKQKNTTVRFKAKWEHNGKEFSCQSQANEDKYLIRRITVTVEYAPRETLVNIRPAIIQEGQTVTLTCSAKGHPDPTFTWLKNEEQMGSDAQLTIGLIKDEQSGNYSCQARNKIGVAKSEVVINVTYVPQVEVKMTSPASEVKQGDTMILICNVKRSNPPPHSFNWFKNSQMINRQETQYEKRIDPDDSGSYTCSATNDVGTGHSEAFQIDVKYHPRKTNIKSEKNVKVGNRLTLTCDTDANPAPMTYSWYRYNNNKRIDSSQWTSTKANELILDRVQRTDKACYVCNATNIINTGEDSEPQCIEVLYPPTNLTLTMDTEVTEGQLITIGCTVESFPESDLTLSSESFSHYKTQQSNTLEYTFNVTSTHAGLYTCEAKNREGTSKTTGRELVVKYRPKHVMVKSQPGLTVIEKSSLTLQCSAQSYPAATSFIWMKMTDGKSEIIQKTETIKINSVSPSDSGWYNCSASNEIGTGNSEQVDVQVQYGPKHTQITRAEQQQPDGETSVMLSCSSHSNPPVKHYLWYKKTGDNTKDEELFVGQNFTVYSDKPGIYYCVAKNEKNQASSDPVSLFVDRGFIKALQIFFLVLIILVVLISFVCRFKRNKSIQGNTNTPRRCIFLRGGNHARGRLNEPITAGPSTSRDDLLLDQPRRPEAWRCQPRPDNTTASDVSTVYSTVNLPAAKPGHSAQDDEQDNSLNYASLQFWKTRKNKNAKVKEEVVYAVTCKKNGPERLEVYENNSAAQAANIPNPWNDDTDTSEDEAELSYAQVRFKMKPGHQKAARESSSSEDDETQYSEVKI